MQDAQQRGQLLQVAFCLVKHVLKCAHVQELEALDRQPCRRRKRPAHDRLASRGMPLWDSVSSIPETDCKSLSNMKVRLASAVHRQWKRRTKKKEQEEEEEEREQQWKYKKKGS